MPVPLNDYKSEDIRIKRKLQIMNAALKVFADNGIRLTKVSMITEEAGISHGLLYHYFSSKEEVLHESLKWAVSEVEEDMQEILNCYESSIDRIKAFTKFAFIEGNSNIFRIIQHIYRANDIPEDTIELIESHGNLYEQFLAPLFVEGQEQGEIIQGDVNELVEVYLTSLAGIIMTEGLMNWKENIDYRTRLFLRMVTVQQDK
ncbi:TetR/AcrR family transcriptional regulator [Niallia sp.]|uniref:TetR/AcrR family transcriptional regulator n=1 Tax=Niallia sp. TaxID=2837523 RepID=UPI00289C317F|nr:TetR/AcrR family transcriptional regulator [Niallia sp.]